MGGRAARLFAALSGRLRQFPRQILDGFQQRLRASRKPARPVAAAARPAADARRGKRSAASPSRVFGFVAQFEPYVPRWAGLAATGLVLAGSLGFGIVRGDHLGAVMSSLREARDATANMAGFRIAEVAVNGRKQLTVDDVLAIGGVSSRASLLFLDAAGMRARLKRNPWISEATVLKLYPGRLQVDITERSAFALWQMDGHVSVIAEDGAILDSEVTRRVAALPLVVGRGADTRAKEFLSVLDRHPAVRGAVKAAVLIGERRWNLRLTNGIDVKLPEDEVEAALTRLTGLERDDHLFSRDITVIDLRLPDRVTVRLSEGAAGARAARLKEKKNARKAGDA
jgi:cell division protein FtsQ